MHDEAKASRKLQEIKRQQAINNYLSGMSQRKSLQEAGYSPSVVRSANQWFNQPYVLRVLEEKRQTMYDENNLSQKWIVERLMRIADVSLGELLELDEDGNLFPNWEKMTDDMKKNIQSLDVETTLVGRGDNKEKVHKVKVRSADQLRALEKLMSILGIDKKVHEVHSMSDNAKQLMEANRRLLEAEDENSDNDDGRPDSSGEL